MIAWRSLLRRAPVPLLGIDISSSSVKLVELGRNRSGHVTLERCATEPLEPGWVNDGAIEHFDEVAEAVRCVLRKSGSKTRKIAMALPASAVITKKIILPAGLSDRELEARVASEAHEHVPFSMDEVSLDFCVMGPGASSGQVQVLIAASRKEHVWDRQGLAEAAGLEAVVMDVESHASRLAAGQAMEALPDLGQDAVVALFEVGAVTTSVRVMCNDDMLHESDHAFGGAQLTRLIVHQYGFSVDEAEAKKCAGDLPTDCHSAVLEPFVESLAQAVEIALQQGFARMHFHRVDHILLAGGSAALPGLADAVTQQTSVACRVINPFDGMAMASRVHAPTVTRAAPSYLTATGLALRRFHP